MTTRKMKYPAFGDTLSLEVAYLQAAYLLDVAAEVAIKYDDVEHIQTVAVCWMELGKMLGTAGETDQDDEDDEEEIPVVVGFVGRKQHEMEIVSDNE